MATIPGVPDTMVHPRERWMRPGTTLNAPAYQPANVHTGITHYRGVTTTPNIVDIQQAYDIILRTHDSRSYGYYYNFAVISQAGQPFDGHIIEGRGFDYSNAANRGRKWQNANPGQPAPNTWTISVTVWVNGQADAGQPATPAAQHAVRSIFTEAQRRHQDATGDPEFTVWPHQEIEWTSCCGAGLIAQTRNGDLDPYPATVEDPPMITVNPSRWFDEHVTDPDPLTIDPLTLLGSPSVVVANLTVLGDGDGYVVAWDGQGDFPTGASVQLVPGRWANNLARFRAGPDGRFRIDVRGGGGPVRVIADLVAFA